MPDCVLEWMDTAPEWHDFQVAIEDSLESERTRRRRLEGQVELLQGQLARAEGSWWDQWAPTLIVTTVAAVSVWIGATAAGR